MKQKPHQQEIGPKALLLYDGRCGLCNRAVRFIMKRRRKDRLRLIPFQQYTGSFPEGSATDDPDSVWLLCGQTWYSRSDAIIQSLIILGFPWNLAIILRIFPLAFRNFIYNMIFRNRYKWFGTTSENCQLPK